MTPTADLLVVGYDLDAESEVHIGDRALPEWHAIGYKGTRRLVCYLCWRGVDAVPGTEVALVPRGRLGGTKRAHFAHPPRAGVHGSRAARETIWHLGMKHRLVGRRPRHARPDNEEVPDEPLYDPDRMVFENLDHTNLDMMSAWLDHPVTQALHEDLGRQLRSRPAVIQRAAIKEGLARDERYRADLAERLAADDLTAEHRAGLQRLLDAFTSNIDGARLRLLELDDLP